MALIEAEDLVKDFRRPRQYSGFLGTLRTLVTRKHVVTRAVDHVNFSVEQGELVGYLGPNGAGKSTTIKMLTGILVPTAGRVEVAGVVPYRQRADNARRIGVVFGQRSQLWWDLPLRESLRLIGKMYDVPRGVYEGNLTRFVELLDLGGFLDTPVRQLSLGQRMRGDLAAAMLYQPRILYLDEPTIGLDVVAKERMRVFIEELNREEGTTVVLTTHDLDDVERLCERIVLIDRGKVLFDGRVEALKNRYAPHREIVAHLADPLALSDQAMDNELGDVAQFTQDDGRLRVRFDPARVHVADVVSKVLAEYTVTDLTVNEPELEGVIREIYAERSDVV